MSHDMYSKRSRSCPKSNTHTLSLQYYEPTKGSRRLKNVGRGCSYIELRRPVSFLPRDIPGGAKHMGLYMDETCLICQTDT